MLCNCHLVCEAVPRQPLHPVLVVLEGRLLGELSDLLLQAGVGLTHLEWK